MQHNRRKREKKTEGLHGRASKESQCHIFLIADDAVLRYLVCYNSVLSASGLRENTDPAELLL